MKYKKWINNVERVRGDLESRLNKLRLDKNERLTHFEDDFWGNIIGKLTQEHVLAYPEVEPLYEKLANFLQTTTEHLVITAGSDSAIKMGFELFVNPGDKVIILNPTFAMVEVYCSLYNAIPIRMGYDLRLNLDIDNLIDAIDEKVTLVIIANPNSPTGTYIDNETIEKIVKKALNFDVPILIDEAYYGFCPHTAINLIKCYENVIITRTFSKAGGLAGLRIGYIVAHPSLAQLLYKFKPMYEINSIAILFAKEILDHREIIDEHIKAVLEGKNYLLVELKKLFFNTIDTLTNFIHVDFGMHKTKILERFKKDNILVKDNLSIRGFENYVRISVGNIEKMQKFVESIKRSIEI